MSTTRKRWYKAAQVTLAGPHFNNPNDQLYLPGAEVTEPELNTLSAYGKGLHYVAHRRVAARWAPVVLEVTVLGEQFKIPEQVAPRYRKDVPSTLAMGKYNKYRTNHIRVERIVGIATYGVASMVNTSEVPDEIIQRYPWSRASYAVAIEEVRSLNKTLARHGRKPMRLTGERLETLRSDHFVLWELEEGEPELQRITVTMDANIFPDLSPSDWRDGVERTVMRAVGSLSYVQAVGSAHAQPAHREPLET